MLLSRRKAVEKISPVHQGLMEIAWKINPSIRNGKPKGELILPLS